MPEGETTIVRSNLREHPATRAWRTLGLTRTEPDCIEILKEGKSAVYRLGAVGPTGSAVIAKRCRQAAAVHERTIYEQILPHLPITALDFYGFLEEPDGRYCWLFLEDAGGERYSPFDGAHRVLAAHWLGALHTVGARVGAAARLPDRGPQHYLEHLRSARETLCQNLAHPALSADDLALLKTIVRRSDRLELGWRRLERFCDELPRTLVHGDAYAANFRVRTGGVESAILTFDWELAGWGSPVADLAQSPPSAYYFAANPDLATYWRVVCDHWPGVDRQTWRHLAQVGTLLRCIAGISWAAPKLVTGRLRFYQEVMDGALREAAWDE
ncbi:MAG: aminoglycoside phosphotransferase family protein [Chloroflexi bacterium]|nr:aminoglycoside phosphotransferase family protein [Chloroflexota bacterium]